GPCAAHTAPPAGARAPPPGAGAPPPRIFRLRHVSSYSRPTLAMSEGPPSCSPGAQRPSAAASPRSSICERRHDDPASRGIDLQDHHHTWAGRENRDRRAQDCPCVVSPEPETSSDGEAGRPRPLGSALLERPAPDVPPAGSLPPGTAPPPNGP